MIPTCEIYHLHRPFRISILSPYLSRYIRPKIADLPRDVCHFVEWFVSLLLSAGAGKIGCSTGLGRAEPRDGRVHRGFAAARADCARVAIFSISHGHAQTPAERGRSPLRTIPVLPAPFWPGSPLHFSCHCFRRSLTDYCGDGGFWVLLEPVPVP